MKPIDQEQTGSATDEACALYAACVAYARLAVGSILDVACEACVRLAADSAGGVACVACARSVADSIPDVACAAYAPQAGDESHGSVALRPLAGPQTRPSPFP